MDHGADVSSGEMKVDEQNSMDTSQNDDDAKHSLPNNSEAAEVATPETKGSAEKKGRGSGRKRKSDADMMAEAKATCGHEIDPSEGRQLRKRPDPPKVEKKTPARKSSNRKSKTPNKEEEANKDTEDKEEEKETMVENDVKEHVDGEKDDDSRGESAAEQQPANGDDAHQVANEAVDSVPADVVVAPTDAAPAPAPNPAEPAAQTPEKSVEEETEQKAEEPERNAPTESTENSTNHSV